MNTVCIFLSRSMSSHMWFIQNFKSILRYFFLFENFCFFHYWNSQLSSVDFDNSQIQWDDGRLIKLSDMLVGKFRK